MARSRANDLIGAADALRHATRRLTQNGMPFFELGLVLNKLGKYQEAESAFLRAMQLAPQPTVYHYYQLGINFLLQNKLSEAQEAQEQAIGLDKSFSRSEYQLGLICNKKGKYSAAIPHFEKALALGDQTITLKKHLVTALYHAAPENFDLARARALCPDHPLLEKITPTAATAT